MCKKICVLGLGYVGLPIAAVFASSGFTVIGVDVDENKVKTVNAGKCYISEPGLDRLLRDIVFKGLLTATMDGVKAVKDSDAVIITVNTPIKENGSLNYSELISALQTVREGFHKDLLVVIESTLPPGTMINFVKPFLEESCLRADKDFYLAHVPERIAPGRALDELRNMPRVIGGIGPESSKRAYELYSKINKNLYVTDATTAEFTKLIENTFRDLNVAYANLLALIAEKMGIDAYEAIRLANTHPRVNIHLPGAGVGGPCLTKDPRMLLSIANQVYGRELIRVARRINDYMPLHMVKIILKAIKRENLEDKRMKIAVLGVAYKSEVDDIRESPAKKIIKQLLAKGFAVVTYDPYTRETFGAEGTSSLEHAVKGTDMVVIVTDHEEFKSADWSRIGTLMRHRIIVDGRRVIEPRTAIKMGFRYYGIGLGRLTKI